MTATSAGSASWIEADHVKLARTTRRIVVDLCQYQSEFDVSTLWAEHGPVTLDRWIIDPAAGKVTGQRLDDRPQEFPRVDERIVSRPHRYGYSAVIREVSGDGEAKTNRKGARRRRGRQTSGIIEVEIDGVTIRVGSGADAKTVAVVIRALKAGA